MKLFSRYNRINILATLFIFLLAGTIFYFFLRSLLINQVDDDLEIERRELNAYVSEHDQLPEITPLRHLKIEIIPVKSSYSVIKFRTLRAADSTSDDMDNFRALDFGVTASGKNYKVTVMKPLETMEGLLWSILVFGLSVILLLLAANYLINRNMLRKLWTPFFTTIDKLRNFSISRPVPLELKGSKVEEFKVLNETLEVTTKKAQQDYIILKEFTENASHEMQTPLAIIRSKLDLLIQDEHLSEAQSVVAQTVYESVQKLSRLNQSLLLLAKIGNSQYEEQEMVDLKEKIEQKMEAFQELWSDEQIVVHKDLKPATVRMNPALADILLNNLLSNATKHNHHGGTIKIVLDSKNLTISNTGQENALNPDRLYQKFYTEKKAAGHTGLGLSIAKHICEVSGMDIGYTFKDGMHSFSITS